MRPNLHLITERNSRRQRAARRADHSRPRNAAAAPAPALAPPQPPTQPHAEASTLREDLRRPDADLRRVRESGGPIDHASYACECGYVFEADVSTTVSCPHCSTPQAW